MQRSHTVHGGTVHAPGPIYALAPPTVTAPVAGPTLVTERARRRAAALDVVLAVWTAGVGWAVWAAALNRRGQTPAQSLLGQRRIHRTHHTPVRWSLRHHPGTITVTTDP